MRDSTIPVRKAILETLKADSDLISLVPAARIWPARVPNNPIWPFVRYGISSDIPFRPSGYDGVIISVAVHCFAKVDIANPDAEAAAAEIKAAIASALDGGNGLGLSLALPDAIYDATANIIVTGGQLLRDADEADAWHGIVNLEVAVAS